MDLGHGCATPAWPEANQIVAIYCAREHPHDLADLVHPPDSADWLTDRLGDPDNAEIETLCHPPAAMT